MNKKSHSPEQVAGPEAAIVGLHPKSSLKSECITLLSKTLQHLTLLKVKAKVGPPASKSRTSSLVPSALIHPTLTSVPIVLWLPGAAFSSSLGCHALPRDLQISAQHHLRQRSLWGTSDLLCFPLDCHIAGPSLLPV